MSILDPRVIVFKVAGRAIGDEISLPDIESRPTEDLERQVADRPLRGVLRTGADVVSYIIPYLIGATIEEQGPELVGTEIIAFELTYALSTSTIDRYVERIDAAVDAELQKRREAAARVAVSTDAGAVNTTDPGAAKSLEFTYVVSGVGN